jgi:G3E family GTPase
MPLFILTGFLGSGKTTLLQRILRSKDASSTGVLINEFGEAGLDHRILSHVADAKVVVHSGCICCSVRPELTRGLLDFVRRSLAGEIPRFDRLVI